MQGTCELCGRQGVVERHHLIGGACRKKAERDGLVAYLCPGCHRLDSWAAHRSGYTMQQLRAKGQLMWMDKTRGSIEDFVREYGKNYLEG